MMCETCNDAGVIVFCPSTPDKCGGCENEPCPGCKKEQEVNPRYCSCTFPYPMQMSERGQLICSECCYPKLLTPEQAAVEIIKTVAEALRELGSVPSGHLYARVMNFLNLDAYTRVIDSLKRTGLVTEKNHLLTWTGPTEVSKVKSLDFRCGSW